MQRLHAASCGLEALNGKPGYTRDALIYGGAVILYSQGMASSMHKAVGEVKSVLANGEALARLTL